MKMRNILLGCLVVLVILCLGGGAFFYFSGKALVGALTDGPYTVAKRPMPTAGGDEVDALLPPKVGNFTRGELTADNGASTTYTDGTNTLQVKAGVYPTAAEAQADMQRIGTETENISQGRLAFTGAGFDPSYVQITGGSAPRMAWTRGKYLFDVHGTNQAAIDAFMQAFPY
jgi:hypothetical protein